MTEVSKETVSGEEKKSLNFLEEIIEEDIRQGKHGGRVHTRFPPEPNGFLHIGHAKSICLNFGLAQRYGGKCNLRFDDTNPATEEVRYVESIKQDIHWLGFEWHSEHYASDYFAQLYEWAVQLIREGKAYVDDQSAEEVSATRGTPTQPGKLSPYRDRSVEENLDLFQRMKNGEFPDGSKVLRAKIDMSSPNMHMRDPALYRIKNTPHHRTGNAWCIYPMYDWAHGQSDYLEGITHSICTLEFEVHRPLYDWCLDQVSEGDYRPRQYEFARLNLAYTVMSKRKLLELVRSGIVSGWDDPRMPTLSGMRRRGYTPTSIRNFSERVGVAKRENLIDMALLEYCVREDLNKVASRAMAVINPLKVVLLNYTDGREEMLTAVNNPEDESYGTRALPFSNTLWIERDDFMENPPKKYFRLQPGGLVRLKYAYIIRCVEVVKDDAGEVVELRCEYIPESRSGEDTSGLKVKGTIHWLSAPHAIAAELRMYDRLFTVPEPDDDKERDYKELLNPNSLQVIKDAFVEPSLAQVKPLTHLQFERKGYFCADEETKADKPVFNLTVNLRDTWAKVVDKA
jgi:glutaminyl-tRNA synthetase